MVLWKVSAEGSVSAGVRCVTMRMCGGCSLLDTRNARCTSQMYIGVRFQKSGQIYDF